MQSMGRRKNAKKAESQLLENLWKVSEKLAYFLKSAYHLLLRINRSQRFFLQKFHAAFALSRRRFDTDTVSSLPVTKKG